MAPFQHIAQGIEQAKVIGFELSAAMGSTPGGSPSTLRAFNINLLTSGGGAATPDTAELVRVSFINMYPVGNPDDMAIRQTHWGITVRPLNLASDS